MEATLHKPALFPGLILRNILIQLEEYRQDF